MLASTEISIVTPALRALGNVVTGSDQQTEAVIHAGCIPVICSLLSHSKVSFLVQTFLTSVRGRSQTTFTDFWPFLTPSPPWLTALLDKICHIYLVTLTFDELSLPPWL